ncbi:MAG TPA: cobalamin-dependent protein, partial [Chondromyces sp.]|nr:cobalamin-dependent protein [Chondromyces sp.]
MRRALIVNCYADETRRPVARRHKVPNTLGPVFLAGGLSPERWEIRLHNEVSDGPLEDEALLGWPDLLVLTGLISSVDRMRQVAAYARTKNPRVVVAGGGHVVRALPSYCASFLDYVCLGDVEELGEVVRDAFGPQYAAEEH